MQNIVYVGVVTGHNPPIFEACMTRRPAHIVLLASEWALNKGHAERLRALLVQKLPQSQVHLPPSKGLNGEEIAADSQWLEQHLRPLLQQAQFDGLPRWLNLNGGTKLFSLALTSLLRWDLIDYSHQRGDLLYASKPAYELQGRPGGLQASQDDSPQRVSATPFEVAQLYNDGVSERSPNPLRDHEASLPLAQQIFVALNEQQPALQAIFSKLNELWSERRDDKALAKRSISMPLSELPASNELEGWLTSLEQLNRAVFARQGGELVLPGNKTGRDSPEDQFRRWLSGDWLEQLAQHWLGVLGIPADGISGNLQTEKEQGESASGHEADLFVQHKGRSYLIEIKADVPDDAKLTKLADEFAGNLDFGRAQKILLLGPSLVQRLDKTSMHHLEVRCRNSNIRLARSQAELADAMDGRV